MKDARGHGSDAHSTGVRRVGRMAEWGGALADQVRRFAKSESGYGQSAVQSAHMDGVAENTRDAPTLAESFGVHTLSHDTASIIQAAKHLSRFLSFLGALATVDGLAHLLGFVT